MILVNRTWLTIQLWKCRHLWICHRVLDFKQQQKTGYFSRTCLLSLSNISYITVTRRQKLHKMLHINTEACSKFVIKCWICMHVNICTADSTTLKPLQQLCISFCNNKKVIFKNASYLYIHDMQKVTSIFDTFLWE